MYYKIQIKFTDNNEKTGKMTVTEENGKVLFNKVPVSVPSGKGAYFVQEGLGVLEIKENLHDFVKMENDVDTTELEKKYNKLYIKAKNNNICKFITSNDGEKLLFAPYYRKDNENLIRDSSAIVMDADIFESLFSLLKNPLNKFTVIGEKVTFQFFTEKIDTSKLVGEIYSSFLEAQTIVSLADFTNKHLKIKKKEKTEEEKLVNDISKVYRMDINENILKKEPKKEVKTSIATKSEIKPIKEKVLTSLNNTDINTPNKSRTFTESSSRRSSTNDSNLDPLLIHFMFNYPELAVMYRPNSLLAWMNYFGRDISGMSKEHITNNINNIDGFENVKDVDVKYNKNGYSVSLYNDENKEVLAGNLSVENSDNNRSIKLINDNGFATELKENNSGVWLGNTSNTNLNEPGFSYKFEEKQNEFVGTWGFEANNSISIPMESNINNTTSVYKDHDVSYSSDFDNSNRYEPPPPPPPPPEISDWASSNNSYNSMTM